MNVQVLRECEKRGHEQVAFFHYPAVGLKAVVSIHSTVLGPALGGCRMRLYEDESAALDDAMRLSEGMTYKSSLAGLDLGGGESCIIADPRLSSGRRELFRQFGKCLNDLNGRYISAEDMGTSVEDVMWMREVSSFVTGASLESGGSGDPSPWTARGVFNSIRAISEIEYGTEDLSKLHVAIQGVGHVGMFLTKLLRSIGTKVTVADPNKSLVQRAVKEFGASAVGLEEIYDVPCDIFSPCAIGQTVNPHTIPRLRCRIIAGAANNQLSDATIYDLLSSKRIIYCPDFVINAGGVISVGAELIPGGWNEKWVSDKVHDIYGTVKRVMDESKRRGRFPEIVALELARERVKDAENRKAKD